MQCNKASAFCEQRAKYYVAFKDIFVEHALFKYIPFIFNFPQVAVIAEYCTGNGIEIFVFLLHRSINSTYVMALNAFSPFKMQKWER